jgi:TrmH family RNA methyltransferase
MKSISSRQNATVRAFRELAREPDPTGTRLLLDGVHLVREALVAGIRFELAVVAASRLSSASEEHAVASELEAGGIDVAAASDDVFDAISPVRTPSGIVAIVQRQPVTANDICGAVDPFVLAAVDVQDPGNIGALLRAAEAGGVSGALVCGMSANPFSWKALRGSMGSALRLPVVHSLGADAALATMRNAGLRSVAAVARDGSDPDAIDWSGAVGLLLGGEGPGLSEAVVAACEERVTIPMAAAVESLNVAVAGAILVYAARRQRIGLSVSRAPQGHHQST